jgi:hypothetical protein
VAEVDPLALVEAEPDAEAFDGDADAEVDALAERLGDALVVVVRRATTVTLSPGVPRSWAS